MTPKEEFIALYQAHITRPGADKLLAFLEKSDFFLAPASTRFHLACRGGLLEHSLNVGRLMLRYSDEAPESLAICGLLHDLCKTKRKKRGHRAVGKAAVFSG